VEKELKKSRLYSEELGIKLAGTKKKELFKWFLASILFGKRIPEAIAVKAFRSFEAESVLSPGKIIETGWDGLVCILDNGSYVRYDFSTATNLLKTSEKLLKEYHGDLNEVHEKAKDARNLEEKLMEFHAVGPVTCNIFLRELRPYWRKANPEPLPVVLKIARKMKINLNKYGRKSLAFARVEAGLIRLRRKKFK